MLDDLLPLYRSSKLLALKIRPGRRHSLRISGVFLKALAWGFANIKELTLNVALSEKLLTEIFKAMMHNLQLETLKLEFRCSHIQRIMVEPICMMLEQNQGLRFLELGLTGNLVFQSKEVATILTSTK